MLARVPGDAGNTTDLDVLAQFILDACQVLKPGGRLMLAGNRTFPYEKPLHTKRGNLTTVHNGPRFKALAARR